MNADFSFSEADLTPLEGEEIAEDPISIQSHIAEDMHMQGQLRLKHGIEIAGVFHGEIACNSTVKVLPTGQIEGVLDTHNVSIEGQARLQMTARRRLEVLKNGFFAGSLETQPEVIVLSEYAAFGRDEETARKFKSQYSSAHSEGSHKEPADGKKPNPPQEK